MIWLFVIAALVSLLWSFKVYIVIALGVCWMLFRTGEVIEDCPQPSPVRSEEPRFIPRYPDMSQEYNYRVHMYIQGHSSLELLEAYTLRDWEVS